MMQQTTAILIFSRTCAAESYCKPIIGNNAADGKLWDYLYNKTLRTANTTGLPVIICNESVQEGNSFAERISNALIAGFENGYDNLIVIGGDCLDLNKAILLNANEQITNNQQLVLGPDCRGGVYLFAINKSVFDKEVFLQFKWQTKLLYQQFVQFGASFSTTFLPRLSDINTKDDVLASLYKFSINNSWRLLLSEIIAKNIPLYNIVNKRFQQLQINGNKPLRAPPIL